MYATTAQLHVTLFNNADCSLELISHEIDLKRKLLKWVYFEVGHTDFDLSHETQMFECLPDENRKTCFS